MLWSSVALLLSAAPEAPRPAAAVVLVTRSVGLAPAEAVQLADALAPRLELMITMTPSAAAKRLAELGVPDSTACGRDRECVVRLGKLLSAHLVISLELGALGKSVAVHMDATAVVNGLSLDQLDFVTTKVDLSSAAGDELHAFSKRVSEEVAVLGSLAGGQSQWTRPDAGMEPKPPVVLVVPPADAGAPFIEIRAEPERKSSLPAFAFGGGAVVAGGASAIFLGLGLHEKGLVDARGPTVSGVPTSVLTHPQSVQHAAQANQDFSIAVATTAATAALAALAVGFLVSK